jgi:hypothetical protein
MNIGGDIGFSHTKGYAGDRSTSFPSLVTPNVSSLLSLNHRDRIVIRADDTEYLMGQAAVEIGQGVRKETAQWIGGQEWLALFYGMLSQLTKSTNFDANVVIGLPLSDFEREKQIALEVLRGDHTFLRAGRVTQHCHVKNIWVAPQAWGAILDQLLSDAGKIENPDLGRERYAIIDIGGHNVNFLAVDGLSDIPHESRATERGAWSVMRAVRLYFDQEHPGLSRHKDHRIMRAIVEREIYSGQKRVDLAPVVNPLIGLIGQEIVDTAGQHWGDATTFRQVFVIGGGAHIWGEYIKSAFDHAVVLPEPEMVNARGFAKFAAFQANRGK